MKILCKVDQSEKRENQNISSSVVIYFDAENRNFLIFNSSILSFLNRNILTTNILCF